jgi:16S rRNA G966 N2-methylase RsmD
MKGLGVKTIDEQKNQRKLLGSETFLTEEEKVMLDKGKAMQFLNSLIPEQETKNIRRKILSFKTKLLDPASELYSDNNENTTLEDFELESLLRDLDQIANSYTTERMSYYINRMIKSLTETKLGRINDINLNRWKDYENILTDSLWIFDKRDTSGEHLGWYWGNFVPQIPNQLLQRYSKRGDWILDPFVGSGTTLIECRRLGRNGIGIELNGEVVYKAKERIERENNMQNITTKVVMGDNTELDYHQLLSALGINSVQFVIMHPPYFDILKFSDNPKDLSNSNTVYDFLSRLEVAVKKSRDVLDKNRYLAVVIGDKYEDGHLVPLGFYTMQMIMKSGFSLKSIIVKNFDETKGKRSQKELWRYRALIGEYYIFKHEYIFLFIKE